MSTPLARLGIIRASILIPIVHALDLAIPDTDEVLVRHGLLRAQLRDPYASVPLARYIAFLEEAARRAGEPGFGVRLGAMMRPIDLGPAGLLFSVAPTLRQGLARLGRYLATVQSATQVGLHDHATWAAWVYKLEDPAIWPRAQDSELTLATMCSLVRARLGHRWAPLEVHFEHTPEGRDPALRDIFRAPVRFGQPVTQFLIAAADLDRRLRSEDAHVTPALERHALDLLERDRHAQAALSAQLSDRVRQLIGARMGLDRIGIGSVANALGLSPRSLQRGLAAEGTSLRDLVREHRRRLAEQRLLSGSSSHALIAQAIGYSDQTVFWRAFKRWSGDTPTAFRAGKATRDHP
jgi:AraC-like DNA-binding protein